MFDGSLLILVKWGNGGVSLDDDALLDPRRNLADSAKNFYRLFALLHLVSTVLRRVDAVGQEHQPNILDPLDDLDEDTCGIDAKSAA